MQHINKSIENGMFGLVFVGAFLATGVAAWLQHKAGRRRAALWAGAANLSYVAALMVTMGVDIPLNSELAAAGAPSRIHDLAAVRAKFEGGWVATNMLAPHRAGHGGPARAHPLPGPARTRLALKPGVARAS
ncbi:anthrone oxygenase family protein [Kitasatospora aureofaciens]|uniref:anthrone oxygenase family protein n=1 Tax=Kitasatospora aureofaciens TaxID=1894 RepID=UPI0037CC586B